MSISADGALSNVQPASTESKRATTPSKLFTRQVTPQRSNSAPRSNSNNREVRGNDIALDPHVVRRSRSGAISTRKMRRWENKNLFGVENFSKSKEENIREALNNPEFGVDNVQMEITWRSTLSKLLKPENQDILHDFMTCRDVFTTHKAQSRRARTGGDGDWSDAEEAWIKIEKRIRAAIVRSFATSEVIQDFLADIERVLLHFAHTRHALSEEKLSDELKKDISQPIAVDKSGNLVIPLSDSAFRRLLVHGVAQFYGLQSNSVKTKTSSHKCCLIKFPRAVDAATTASSASNTATAEAGPSSQSPSIKSSRKRASSRDSTPALPATTTRCLSLSQFLAILVQQSHAQGHVSAQSLEDAELGMEVEGAAHHAPTVTLLTALERRLLSLTIEDADLLKSPESLTDNVVLPSYAADSPQHVQRDTSTDSETQEYVVL